MRLGPYLSVLVAITCGFGRGESQQDNNPGSISHLHFNVTNNSINDFAELLSDPNSAWIGEGPDPVDDATWDSFVCKGAQFLDLMKDSDSVAGSKMNPPQESAASPWRDFPNDLAKWGYSSKEGNNKNMGSYGLGLRDCLRAIGVSDRSADWQSWTTSHGDYDNAAVPIDRQQYYGPDGRLRRHTGALFELIINENGGTMIMSKRYTAPKINAARRQPPVPAADLPLLYRASDITWAMWSVTTWENAHKLKYLISWCITNQVTQRTIRRALQTGSSPHLDMWPGAYFPASTPACQALLGSPNGNGVGWFLIQHKAALGNKRVVGCQVFIADTTLAYEPSILFILENL